MSDVVGTIMDGMRTVVTGQLSGWTRMPHVYDVEKNNSRMMRQGYGLRPLDAIPADNTINRTYTVQQGFEIVLADTLTRGTDESHLETSLKLLYNKADDIFKALVNSKAGVPSTVLVVHSPTMPAPEILQAQGLVVLRLQVQVLWRSSLT